MDIDIHTKAVCRTEMAKEIFETQNYEYVVSEINDVSFFLNDPEMRKTVDCWIVANDNKFMGL